MGFAGHCGAEGRWLVRAGAALAAALMLAAVLAVPAWADTVAEGTCGGEGDGTNLTWTLDDEGLLTIEGEGVMPDWDDWSGVPWYAMRDEITAVCISGGVTCIGTNAFIGCTSLASVTIPDSVTSIGIFAFSGCEKLESVAIPNSVETIDTSAFEDCTSLASVSIPDSVTHIGSYAFYECTSLASVAIPDSVVRLDFGAFEGVPAFIGYGSIGGSSLCWFLHPDGCLQITGAGAMPDWDDWSDVPWYAMRDEITAVCISGGVTSISSCAFDFISAFIGYGSIGGSSLCWFLHSDGCLQITGTGTMPDWNSASELPWYAMRDEITSVVIGDDVAPIESCAFDGCQAKCVPAKAATCTEDGIREYYVCTVCGRWYVDAEAEKGIADYGSVVVPALGHAWSQWTPVSTDASKEQRTCSVCKATETRPVESTPLSADDIALSADTYTYSSKANTPAVTVKVNGKTLVKGTDYAITYYNNVYAGQGEVSVAGKGNYTGTVTKHFTINPLDIASSAAAAKMTLSTTAYQYNGKAKKPAVTVTAKVGGATKTLMGGRTVSGVAIKLTYASGRTKVGTYKVTATGTGNYTGTLTKTFKVNPANAYMKSLTTYGKGTLKWTATAKPATKGGSYYQVQYRKQGTSTYKYSTSSKTYYGKVGGGKLTKGKRYYVRVRAVYKTSSGTTYYGKWSTGKLSPIVK